MFVIADEVFLPAQLIVLMAAQEELRSDKEKKRQRRLYIEGLQDRPYIDDESTTPRTKTSLRKSTAASRSSAVVSIGLQSSLYHDINRIDGNMNGVWSCSLT